MDAAAWEKVKELFHAALQDRRVLEGAPGDVRAEVEALLKAHAEAPADPARDEAGAMVGRYKLLQRLGEGGFGVVWMAEQDEPVRRVVALKILKAGMDTGQVVARFEAERQALALMDHPCIAKVLDAGATPAGRPYFVMELVKGIPITAYSDEARLDTRARLDLFVRVCHAVQHAHQKGVIHRDLKPSNILVALDDGRPIPKIIDFGIAKATDQRLTERTLFTEFRQMVGTPDYMAPEQAEMSGLDVDTRADIYSLGVLLYELLTGTKPFDLKAVLQKGYEEILRTIREVDPPRPSNRVSTMGESVTPVAASRRTAPRLLGKLLRGDLDWIVMKALEKERGRRYATANALASDVQRHIADEPVLAGPPHAVYRARKYVRRHRVGATAALLVAAALSAGVVLALGGYVDAAEQRDLARASRQEAAFEAEAAELAEAQEAEQRSLADAAEKEARTRARQAHVVLDLIVGLLSAANPSDTRDPNLTVRDLLDTFDREVVTRLSDEPEVEAAVRLTVGKTYLGLGLADRAAGHIEEALATQRATGGGDRAPLADALLAQARLQHDRGRFEEAVVTASEVVAIRRQIPGAEPALAEDLDYLSDMLRHVGRLDEAEQAGREALALRRAQPRSDVVASLDQLATVLTAKGDLDGAERLLAEAIDLRRPAGGVELAVCLSHLADVRFARGNFAAAAQLERDGLAVLRDAVSAEHPQFVPAKLDLASALLAAGQVAEAERCAAEALAASDKVWGAEHAARATPLVVVSQVRLVKGDLDGAEAGFRDALALVRASGVTQEAAHALMGLGQVALARGDVAAAVRSMREALDVLKRTVGEGHHWVGESATMLGQILFMSGDREGAGKLALEALGKHRAHLLLALAGSYLVGEGRHADAEPLLRECLAIREREIPDDWARYNAMTLLGECLAGQGRYAEAEPLLLEGYEKMSPPFPMQGRKGEALDRIVKLYEAWGKPEKAAEWREKGGLGGGK